MTVQSCNRDVTFESAPQRAVSNDVNLTEMMLALGLTDHMADGDRFYFAHSYYVVADDPTDVMLRATYGRTTFAAGVGSGNIAGMQFHPEKSHRFGMALLSRFAGLNA